MSFFDCLDRAVAAGEIDEATAGDAKDWHKRYLRKHQATGEPNADQLAAAEATEQLIKEAKKKAQQKYLKLKTTKNIFEQIRDYRTQGTGKQKPLEAGLAIFDSTGLPGVPGIYQIQREYAKRAHSMLASFMGDQRKNILGNSSDEAQLMDVVREIFGERTGSKSAQHHAKAWTETAEWLRTEFNRAGGDIPFRKDWGLPQMHDWHAIRELHFPSWQRFTYDLLDVPKMQEQFGMTSREIFDSLEGVFENISSNGTKQIDFDAMGFKKAKSSTRMDSRFLIFKDADSWMEYQERFGNGDPYSLMMSHIDTMARDIALMKKLGPNPANGLDVAIQTVKKFNTELGVDGDPKEPLEDLFKVLTGEANMPVNAKWARRFANIRQLLTGVQLGSAVVSAVTDPYFMSMTAKFNGMSATKVMERALKSVNPAEHESMLRLGLNAESWANAAADMARFHDEALASPFFQKLSSGVLRASGLNYWTDLWRWSFERELLSHITENAKHGFRDVQPELQRALKRYGITPDEWEIIRNTPQYDAGDGAMYLRTQDIARRQDLSGQLADELSLKLAGFIDNETNFAVPTGSLRGKRAFGNLGRPGTFWGEITRSGMMYKNFPITILMTHMRRSFDEIAQGRAGYMTMFMVGTTIMGAFALQLKALKDGKTIDEMFTENGGLRSDFLMRALLQGGGLGIYGDFLLQDHTRYGNSMGETIAGPGVASIGDAISAAQFLGIALMLAGDGTGDASREAYKAYERLSNYVPGRSLWYLSAAYKRAFQDNLKAMGSKTPKRRLQRMIKNRRDKQGGGFWWDPGETVPF